MRHLIQALVTALVAAFATSSLIAIATAAPPPERTELTEDERELVAVLDGRLQAKLEVIKAQLDLN